MSALEQAAAAFADWRSTRTRRGPTPSHLIELAVSLAGEYSKTDIVQSLGVNHRVYNLWLADNKDAMPFVEVTTDLIATGQSQHDARHHPLLEASVVLNSGVTLSLTGEPLQIAELFSLMHQRGNL